MEKQKDKSKRLLSFLRRYNSEIDEICRDWERSQKKKGGEEMSEYVIKEYIPATQGPAISVVTEDELWKILQSVREGSRKISMYKLGDCILDWS